MYWLKHEGYYEIHQFIDREGQIVGEVLGSRFEPSKGWTVRDMVPSPCITLGVYVSLEQAQAAFNRYFEARKNIRPTNALPGAGATEKCREGGDNAKNPGVCGVDW